MAASLSAIAAGMGKITVLSGLGQPLRAELDVTATREEQVSLVARVAPPEAFRQANLEYTGTLTGIKFVLSKRADGRPYFKIQTDRPVNDPFIDMLVELSWSSGRLVREYAFLLDPPSQKALTAPVAPVDAPVAKSAVEAEPPVAVEPAEPVPVAEVPVAPPVKPTPSPKSAAVPKVVEESPAAANAGDGTREVKRGDTLSEIAAESRPEGVTMNQMLVALLNSNRDAFSGGNMNRLRVGKILAIPDAAQIAAVTPAEANKVVVAQMADFNSYRNALATAAGMQEPGSEQAPQSAGGAIAPVVEETGTAPQGKDKLQVSRNEAQGGVSEEDRIAREKALSEANSRIADLEKNLGDLKQLAEIKSQAAGTGTGTGETVPATAATGEATAVATEASSAPAVAAAPVEEQPKPKKKRKPVALPPEPEPGFIESNPMLVYGGGAALVGLLGFLGFRTWKRRREEDLGGEMAFGNDSTASVLGMGEAVEPQVIPPSADPLETSLHGMDLKDAAVDPIQEAEVYMAYGRDNQAEEILQAAKLKDPGNLPVYAKLLEIYSGRNSVSQFNEVAMELHERTGGAGSEWQKAVEMGRLVDPDNALYGANEVAGLLGTGEMASHTLDIPLDEGGTAEASLGAGEVEDISSGADIDFDLDLDADYDAKKTVEGLRVPDLDIDLGAAPGDVPDLGNTMDFDLGETLTLSPTDQAAVVSDVSMASPAPTPIDFSSISLDLDPIASAAPTLGAGDSAEVASKLELAQAYEEMGDRDGARELLQEVLAEGSEAQKEVARNKLAGLG